MILAKTKSGKTIDLTFAHEIVKIMWKMLKIEEAEKTSFI